MEHKVNLPANLTESQQDKREEFAVRHNVRIVGVPKCPESWSTASVYALLERVFNLDEVPLLESQAGSCGASIIQYLAGKNNALM